MSNRPQDYFGASPKTVLNKPFFHAQDQKVYNVNGGTSVADAWTTRDLNTVIYNDISGASLSGNAVSLPAGTYYVEGRGYLRSDQACSYMHAIFVSSSNVLTSTSYGTPIASLPAEPIVSGVITLSESSLITLKYYTGVAMVTYGLGRSNNLGSITDPAIPSIYADLKIWQLDRSLEIAPKAVNSGLQTVPSLDTTGNMMGFDISKTGANQLTITKGSCLDSTLTTPLAFTADKTLDIPSVANTIYHIFCVKTTSEVFEARAYTTEAGVLSDGTVDKFRWIGFVRTNGGANIVMFSMEGDTIVFHTASENRLSTVISGTSPATAVTLDHSPFLPESRIAQIIYSPRGATSSNGRVLTTLDFTNTEAMVGQNNNEYDDSGSSVWTTGISNPLFLPYKTTRGFWRENFNMLVQIQAVKLRR